MISRFFFLIFHARCTFFLTFHAHLYPVYFFFWRRLCRNGNDWVDSLVFFSSYSLLSSGPSSREFLHLLIVFSLIPNFLWYQQVMLGCLLWTFSSCQMTRASSSITKYFWCDSFHSTLQGLSRQTPPSFSRKKETFYRANSSFIQHGKSDITSLPRHYAMHCHLLVSPKPLKNCCVT